MTIPVQIDEARRSLQQDLRAKAKKKRELAKAKRPPAKARASEASLNEIRDAISALHEMVKKGTAGSVSFNVTERDSSGRIKSFTVDQR